MANESRRPCFDSDKTQRTPRRIACGEKVKQMRSERIFHMRIGTHEHVFRANRLRRFGWELMRKKWGRKICFRVVRWFFTTRLWLILSTCRVDASVGT